MMKRTVIYGGSFDPVHKGHENIINNLADRFDEVLVVPAYISPFKAGNKTASPTLRVKMLESCDFKPNVTISTFEVERNKCSYSIDTVRHFSSPDRELYFAIGSEGARTLDKWFMADELKKLCKFYVIPRPGYDKTIVKGLTYADFAGMDVSSSEVKAAVAFGKHNALVNDNVAAIIDSNELYRDYKKFTDAYPLFDMKSERIEHIYRATVEGIKLAKRYDVNIDDCIIALIMHDIGKYVTEEKLEKMGIHVSCESLPPSCRHAEYGAEICSKYFGLKKEIVEAVRTHTTCGMNMDALAEIVALADYIEPARKFIGIDEVRAAATIDLDFAIEKMLGNTIKYLQRYNKYIVPVTIDVYRKYAEKNKGKFELWKSKK